MNIQDVRDFKGKYVIVRDNAGGYLSASLYQDALTFWELDGAGSGRPFLRLEKSQVRLLKDLLETIE